jgi:hypothetical protein
VRPAISVLAVFFVLACTHEPPPRPRLAFAVAPSVPREATRVSLEVDEWSCWGGTSHRIDVVVEGARVHAWTERHHGGDETTDADGVRWSRDEWDATRARINAALVGTWPRLPGTSTADCKVGANMSCGFLLRIDDVWSNGCCEGALFEMLREM